MESVSQSDFRPSVPPDESLLCPELAIALEAMRTIEPIAVLTMGYENIKAPVFESQLDRPPSEAMLEAARVACAAFPRLNFNPLSIACLSHDSAIYWRYPEKGAARRRLIIRSIAFIPAALALYVIGYMYKLW